MSENPSITESNDSPISGNSVGKISDKPLSAVSNVLFRSGISFGSVDLKSSAIVSKDLLISGILNIGSSFDSLAFVPVKSGSLKSGVFTGLGSGANCFAISAIALGSKVLVNSLN